MLSGLPKTFESGVNFKPGNGTGVGYICYPVEERAGRQDEARVWFTSLQYKLNLSNDIALLMIMMMSVFIIWYRLKNEVQDMNTRQSNDLATVIARAISKGQERTLYKTAAFVCTPYIILRLPLYIYGRDEIIDPPVGLGVCILLYDLQFCIHFLVYAFLHQDYQKAYHDMLRVLFPRCIKERETDRDTNAAQQPLHLPKHF